MRFMSVVLGLLCLPLLAVVLVLSPVIVPALCLLAIIVPGLAVFKRTSDKRSWNLASYHSPHSLTWRWILGLTLGRVLVKPCIHLSRSHFAGFAFSVGFGGAHAHRNSYGWQFEVWLLGMHIQFSQQRPMWYRDMIQRAWNEKDAVVRANIRLRESLAAHNAARPQTRTGQAAHLN